ncbi:MAG TPA: Wzz/FepE/Etk N-terminal domain-containing protein [Streptosporangiaceae bacterium]|nr:Wzz/FepE/Etk N-terminal domain-containing protein [Streptosporangiaceae bacterium]
MTTPHRNGSRPPRAAMAAVARRRRTASLTGLISLGYIGSALRRRAWVWLGTTLAGLVISLCLFIVAPPAYQAQTSVLITNDSTADPELQMQGDVVLAENTQVAQVAMVALADEGKPSSTDGIGGFAASYSAAAVSDRILQITARANSSAEAVAEADAVTRAFLRFRAYTLRRQQDLAIRAITPLVKQRSKEFDALSTLLAKVSADPPSAARTASLKQLRKKYRQEGTVLGALAYTLTNYPVVTTTEIQGTQILDPAAPIPPSRKHLAVLNAIAGLCSGFGLGIIIVAIGAVLSDRPRVREDIARALGARVRSVGKPGLLGRLPLGGRLGYFRGRTARRLADQLREAIPPGRRAALTVVAADDVRATSAALASLAISCAEQGRRVVLADLSGRARAARLLGARGPGVHQVQAGQAQLVVAVPDPGNPVPTGPFTADHSAGPGGRADVLDACRSADLVLSLATVDPVVGAEHLATWASDAAVVITAGRSELTTIHSIGELIKIAGLRLAFGVLASADKADESFGFVSSQVGWRQPSRV